MYTGAGLDMMGYYYVQVTKRRLPLGIQTFGKIRQTDSYYVDKTAWIWRLVKKGHPLLPFAPAAVR